MLARLREVEKREGGREGEERGERRRKRRVGKVEGDRE